MPKFAILFLLAATTLAAQGSSQTATQPKGVTPSKAFTDILKAVFNRGEYRPKYPQGGKWSEGGASYSLFEPSTADPRQNDLVAYETATGKRSILVPAKAFVPAGSKDALSVDDYTWSVDNKLLLLFTNSQKVWRLNTRGDYWLLSLSNGKLTQLGKSLPAATLMFAKLSPDNKSAAYVSQNNLYVEDLATNTAHQITTDGSYEIINGTSDWVTEEELSLRDAFRWSPDSQSIAYWQFDQSGVSEYTLINDTKSAYPETFKYKYPHPGGTNSSVKVGVIPAKGGATTWVKLPGDPRNNYIPRMEWVQGRSDQLILQYLNRLQNDSQIYLANAQTGEPKALFEDKDPAFVDIPEDFNVALHEQFEWVRSTGNAATHSTPDFLWLSERDGWQHAYLVSSTSGQAHLITNFPADVISEVSVDEKNGWFYFTASPTNPTQTYLYRSHLDGTGTPERITPDSQPGTHSYYVAPGGQYALHTYSSAAHPPTFDVVELATHKLLRTTVDNQDLIAKEDAINPNPVEFSETSVQSHKPGQKIGLSTSLIKPPHFDPTKKYPILIYVYSEPAQALVKDAWSYSMQRAISSEGYAVVTFDNEGTPAPRGREWRKCIYGNIGTLSTQQQDEAILEFARTHPWVDTTRIGMWGHSGGGSATLNELFRNPGRLAAGVSIAPAADQLLYDSIYQERYMGLPSTNAKGYHDGSPITYAEGLADPLLIIHGSGDDNVHFQGTEMLVDKLISMEKPFQFMDYPNRTHSLSEGKGTLEHRFTLMLHFFEDHIPPGPK